MEKKLKKNEYKYGYYALSPSYQNLTYIFIKKNGKYIFKVYGNILIGYRYLESKNPNFEVQMELLNIKLKEKFKIFLNKKPINYVLLDKFNLKILGIGIKSDYLGISDYYWHNYI